MVAVKLREVKNLSKLPPPPHPPKCLYISCAKLTVIWRAYLREGICQLTNRNANVLLGNFRDPVLKENIWKNKIPGGRVLPIMSYTGRLRPKGIPFFRLQVYKRVGISLVVVCKRIRKSVISSVKRPKRANRCILWWGKSREKYSGLVINSRLKESAFTALKWVQYSKPGN